MTHMPGVPVDGDYSSDWKLMERPCHKCGKAGSVYRRSWESSCGGYDDAEFECRHCGAGWWIDGSDS